ncbi:Mov34/MPN/PAD-1 family protein [Albimonas donghaensis]|uniref:Mov34/MPN/PAD-1 family protein n=1 Tax=Albimonas donghaensis TaxID=356660 RepID=UPI003CCC2B72
MVTFSSNAIRDMVAAATAAKGNETGGVLIGRYSSDFSSAWVEKATAAPSDSEAGPTWFIRGRSGLDWLLRRSWSAGSHYLGEWHSHPAYHPSPSSDDLQAIQKIAEDRSYRCQRPILAIIGGSFEKDPLLAVTLANRSGRTERLADIRNGP